MIPDTEAIIDASQYLPRSVENLEIWEDDNKLFFRDAFNKKKQQTILQILVSPQYPPTYEINF